MRTFDSIWVYVSLKALYKNGVDSSSAVKGWAKGAGFLAQEELSWSLSGVFVSFERGVLTMATEFLLNQIKIS